jgi:organic hydroperoxide reductase OsmC/OhrA
MSAYRATVSWHHQGDEDFLGRRYSRAHVWSFDGGAEVQASASPHVVPLPYSVAAHVDPEEAFIVALASCHMLFFLSLAAGAGFVVESYTDCAEGVLARDETGALAMTDILLSPCVRYRGVVPTPRAEELLHESAHAACFLANSVKTRISVEPALAAPDS